MAGYGNIAKNRVIREGSGKKKFFQCFASVNIMDIFNLFEKTLKLDFL
jgi:hypothetical protein